MNWKETLRCGSRFTHHGGAYAGGDHGMKVEMTSSYNLDKLARCLTVRTQLCICLLGITRVTSISGVAAKSHPRQMGDLELGC